MKDSWIRKTGLILIIWLAVVAAFYLIAADDWKLTAVMSQAVSRGVSTGEITEDTVVQQTFHMNADLLEEICLDTTVFGNREGHVLTLTLASADDASVIWEKEVPYTELNQDGTTVLTIMPAVELKDRDVCLSIRGEGGVSLWYGTQVSAGRFQLDTDVSGTLLIGDKQAEGQLVMAWRGSNRLNAHLWIWPIGILAAAGMVFLAVWEERSRKSGKYTIISRIRYTFDKYGYLLRQLVERDFRVKYKASVLGVLWSIMNPLLMAMVYYFVFSTIFRNETENFIVYLISGIVLFNYFSEGTSLGLMSIVNNANLITKVYMPKFIFPISRTLSSAINLVISFIPLFFVMLVTGVPFHKSVFLLPFVVMCLVLFTAGVSMILSTLNVFFRDTQFLWSILIMMWNFVTPIFYPDSIIPMAYRTIYHANMLYQFCYFTRTILISGVSPAPVNYLYCLLGSLLTFAFGLFIFRKYQNQFVLHL